MESKSESRCIVSASEPDVVNIDGKKIEYSNYQKLKGASDDEQHTG